MVAGAGCLLCNIGNIGPITRLTRARHGALGACVREPGGAWSSSYLTDKWTTLVLNNLLRENNVVLMCLLTSAIIHLTSYLIQLDNNKVIAVK